MNYTIDDYGRSVVAVGMPGSLARRLAEHPTRKIVERKQEPNRLGFIWKITLLHLDGSTSALCVYRPDTAELWSAVDRLGLSIQLRALRKAARTLLRMEEPKTG